MASNINLLPDLPAEIIEFQILSRLPVKSLLQFRLVCKSWKLLISSNPYFVKTHLDNSNSNSLILRRCMSESTDFEDDFELREYSKIIGCINGLVCFFNWRTGCLKELVPAIWNPATRQCVVISALTDKTADVPYCVGFGFDSIANDYKVVYVTTIMGQPLVGFMYSHNLDRWKKIEPSNFLYHGTLLNSNQPAIVNGSIYWLNLQADGRLTVISFDVRHKVFRLLPDSFDKKREKDVVLVNTRDCVAVIFYHRKLSLWTTFDVHIFNDRCGEWGHMSVGPFMGQDPPTFLLAQKLLACFPNGDILFAGPDLELYSISPEKHTIKCLKSPEKKGNIGNYYFDGCIYSESLIFLEGMKSPWYDHHEVEVFSLEED